MANNPTISETAFEKPRGLSKVEIRDGYAQVHIFGLSEPLVESRLKVLDAVASVGASIDFVKLTLEGLSFLVRESLAESIAKALEQVQVSFTLQEKRSIVLVYAVNIRDEEGMIARIVQGAIRAGVKIGHLGDMHDRMLMVVSPKEAQHLAEVLQKEGLA